LAADKDNIVVKAGTMSVDAIDVGHTEGGIRLRPEKTYYDVISDQVSGVARKHVVEEKMFILTQFLEGTLTNLLNALNEPAANAVDGSTLNLGSASPSVTEHTIVFVGGAPNSGTRTFTATRGIFVNQSEMVFGQRDGASAIPVEIELLKDEDNGNVFGTVVDT